MSKTRMAGEALKDANFEARSRLSNDPAEAERRAGLVTEITTTFLGIAIKKFLWH